MPSFGKTSLSRLETCHALLQEVAQRVVEHYDITILQGHRTQAEQDAAVASRASKTPWPNSKHNQLPSMALDAAPWPIPDSFGDLTAATHSQRDMEWKERVKFYEMIACFRFAWSQMMNDFPELQGRYRLRFGADWDSDGDYRNNTFDDLVHIELLEVGNG